MIVGQPGELDKPQDAGLCENRWTRLPASAGRLRSRPLGRLQPREGKPIMRHSKSPITVGVFNDIRARLQFMQRLLADAGDITVAARGTRVEDVTRLARTSSIDVFIINWSLPGASALQSLRKECPAAPAILWTSWISLSDPDYSTILQAQALGFDAIVNYPWRKPEITEAIRGVYLGDGFRRTGARAEHPNFAPLAQIVGRRSHRLGAIRELLLARGVQVWLVDSSPKEPIPPQLHPAADLTIFTSPTAYAWAAEQGLLSPPHQVPAFCFRGDPEEASDPSATLGSSVTALTFDPDGIIAATDTALGPQHAPQAFPQRRERQLPETSTEGASIAARETMTCRQQLLTVATSLVRITGNNQFTVDQLLRLMRAFSSGYKVSTIRTHITSLMCVNAPKHHGTPYPDFVRVRRGQYRLTDDHLRDQSGLWRHQE